MNYLLRIGQLAVVLNRKNAWENEGVVVKRFERKLAEKKGKRRTTMKSKL